MRNINRTDRAGAAGMHGGYHGEGAGHTHAPAAATFGSSWSMLRANSCPGLGSWSVHLLCCARGPPWSSRPSSAKFRALKPKTVTRNFPWVPRANIFRLPKSPRNRRHVFGERQACTHAAAHTKVRGAERSSTAVLGARRCWPSRRAHSTCMPRQTTTAWCARTYVY